MEPKLPCAVDEPVAHGPVLGHAHERRVDGRVAVRVVALHRLADDAGALAGRGGRAEAEVVHGDEDAPLRRLEPVAHVGQGPADDDAHRVGEVAVLQLVGDVERFKAVGGGDPVQGLVRRRRWRSLFVRQFRHPREKSRGRRPGVVAQCFAVFFSLYFTKSARLSPPRRSPFFGTEKRRGNV